jgi:ABC-type dipeptide/oligopeptide/nickel transport system ATPase subunit
MAAEDFLRIEALSKTFAGRPALRNVSLTLAKGRALGLVGPSGSGKSTLARCIAGFETADAGRIWLDGLDCVAVSAVRQIQSRDREGAVAGASPVGLPTAPSRSRLRSKGGPPVQLIFQEAAASLNPRFTAGEIIAEPLLLSRSGTPASHRKRAGDWMETVGIPRAAIDKRALAFSGGERQRLALARALAAEPRLLILDESLSGLDVILQAQIGRLLLDLRRRLELTCILITHDLSLARRLADEIAVIEAGEIVEHAPAAELFAAPRHPRTRELLAASLSLAVEGA